MVINPIIQSVKKSTTKNKSRKIITFFKPKAASALIPAIFTPAWRCREFWRNTRWTKGGMPDVKPFTVATEGENLRSTKMWYSWWWLLLGGFFHLKFYNNLYLPSWLFRSSEGNHLSRQPTSTEQNQLFVHFLDLVRYQECSIKGQL